ncbi:EF-hand domain-containing protein [Arhodomonas sp. SL1]|uniref:EF-hand domain-containing protein n=1 Tax=Arhodomonas sp. SL1 TaxID=3425691 RepID=UPI003F884B77
MHKGKLIIGALAITVGAAGIAIAGPGRMGGGHAMGLNPGDLPASVEDLRNRHAERFAAADANGDGQVDADEMQEAMMRWRAERRVQRLDSDGDGLVSEQEFVYPMERRLMRMDRDGDGQIGPREMGRGERWDDDDDDDYRRKDRRYDD